MRNRRRGPLYAIFFGHTLDHSRAGFVYFEVFRQIAGPEWRDVGFVPNFEIPGLHFIVALALAEVARQRGHKCAPLYIEFRRADIAAPPEDRFVTTGKIVRHEGQFHERFQSYLSAGSRKAYRCTASCRWGIPSARSLFGP